MDQVTISKKTLERLTREVLDIWQFDGLDLTCSHARGIAMAMDEAIEALGMQEQLSQEAEIARQEAAAEWRARQAAEAAKNGEAN